MKGTELLYALNFVSGEYVQEASEKAPAAGRRNPYVQCFAAAACLCLALLGVFRLGAAPAAPGPEGPAAVIFPVASTAPAEAEAPDPLEPPQTQKVTIQWEFVAVNEAEGVGLDAARLWRDPELYEEELLDAEAVTAYYGWELAPAYIPEGLIGGGNAVAGRIVREKETGNVVEDQVGRGFWVDFWEDGSPKSDDDIVIPKGFTVTASKLGILRCGLLPVDNSRTTDFDRTPVTISHCSMMHGPFDPTRKAPDGFSNMPAGYYDIYVASFTLEGVEYEVMAQRMELEELIKIVASIISPYEDIIVGVGCGMP